MSEETSLRNCDVLLGRGNGIATWIGNKTFRRIVVSYKAAYRNAYRPEQSIVSKQVIEEVHERGGRFVEMHPSGAIVEVSYVKALQKTCQCLREKSLAAPGDSEDSEIVLPEKCSKRNVEQRERSRS
jgi:hypothetical protein